MDLEKFDQETDLVIGIIKRGYEDRAAEEHARLEVSTQLEAAKYRMYMCRQRRVYHTLSQILWVLCGGCAALATAQILLGGGLVCLLATIFTFGSMLMAMSCDKHSRCKKSQV